MRFSAHLLSIELLLKKINWHVNQTATVLEWGFPLPFADDQWLGRLASPSERCEESIFYSEHKHESISLCHSERSEGSLLPPESIVLAKSRTRSTRVERASLLRELGGYLLHCYVAHHLGASFTRVRVLFSSLRTVNSC